MKSKTYPFKSESLTKIKKDITSDKTDKVINVVYWGIIGYLIINGTFTTYGIVKMAACTGTSKVVRLLVK